MTHFARIAVEHNVAVFMVTHINRSSAKEDRITLSSMHGASEIEKLASTVMCIEKLDEHREGRF